MSKKRLSQVFQEYKHVYQHSNNNLSGYQSLQVLNYQLETSKQTKWNLAIGIPAQPKDSLAQVDTWTTCACKQYNHVSLQLHSMLKRVITYYTTL